MLLSTVFVLQKKNLSDLNKDIKSSSDQLQGVQDLNKILTVQNQLGALTDLHDQKVADSRLMGFMTQVTPANTKVTKLLIDHETTTLAITGTADNLTTVNKFTDTLKFTKFTVGSDTTEKNAFSNVVLSAFTRDKTTTTFEIALKFNPDLFSNAQDAKLNVPKIITTRSEVDKPTELFQQGGQQ
ncbi:MAG TPA: hypothetical protein VF733_02605 [Candidatus Saccharimonadales bacterium]